MRRRFRTSTGAERARVARDADSYLHLPLVAGIVEFALELEMTLSRPGIRPSDGSCSRPSTSRVGDALHVRHISRSTRVRLHRSRSPATAPTTRGVPRTSAALAASGCGPLSILTARWTPPRLGVVARSVASAVPAERAAALARSTQAGRFTATSSKPFWRRCVSGSDRPV